MRHLSLKHVLDLIYLSRRSREITLPKGNNILIGNALLFSETAKWTILFYFCPVRFYLNWLFFPP